MGWTFKRSFWALCLLGAGFLSAGVCAVSANVDAAAEAKTTPPASDSSAAASSAQAKPAAPAAEEDEFLGIKDIFAQGFPVKETPVPKLPVDVASPSEVVTEKIFSTKGLNVTGLVWGHPDAKAIINGQIYSIGDTINDAKIMRIDAEGIVVRYLDKNYLWKRDRALSVLPKEG